MSVEIAQDSRYLGDERWEWSVWIEGDLDQVESVVWHLHPTFPNPIREMSNRDEQFKLTAHGWGEFELRAAIHLRDGSIQSLSHWIDLSDPAHDPPAGDEETPPAPRAFISASLGDAEIVDQLRKGLEDLGVEAVDGNTAPVSGTPLSMIVDESIASADIVIPVISGAHSSLMVERDIRLARSLHQTIAPLVVGGADLPGFLADLQAIHVAEPSDVAEAASAIADRLR